MASPIPPIPLRRGTGSVRFRFPHRARERGGLPRSGRSLPRGFVERATAHRHPVVAVTTADANEVEHEATYRPTRSPLWISGSAIANAGGLACGATSSDQELPPRGAKSTQIARAPLGEVRRRHSGRVRADTRPDRRDPERSPRSTDPRARSPASARARPSVDRERRLGQQVAGEEEPVRRDRQATRDRDAPPSGGSPVGSPGSCRPLRGRP